MGYPVSFVEMVRRGLLNGRTVRCMSRGILIVTLCLTTMGAANPLGIVVHIPTEHLLDETTGLGVGWIRIDVLWALVEYDQDVFDWSRYDTLVEAAEARGLRIYATITGTPAWATDGSEARGVPSSANDWTDFCYRAAARYRGRVDVWGMWNEPNLDVFWEGTLQEYLSLILRRGADAVHAADPDAMVAGPELAHLGSANWDGWLLACALGAADELDIVSHHVYPTGVGAANVRKKLDNGESGPFGQPSVRRVLNDAGWTGRPFWLTETGVGSAEQGEFAQSVFYSEVVEDWFPTGGDPDWVDAVIFYELVDDANYPEFSFGVIGPPPELEHKLAYDAYAAAVTSATADDARITGVEIVQPITPGRPNAAVVVVENLGTRSWGPEDGLVVEVVGAPETWAVSGGAVPTTSFSVAPGESVAVEVELEPPEVGPTYPNLGYDLVFHLTRPDGSWLGLPRRQRVVSGWKPLPGIVVQPLAVVADEGGAAQFRVLAESPTPLVYRWYRNSLAVEDGDTVGGAETNALVIDGVSPHDTGEYWCRVTSDAGWVDSRPARLILTSSDDGGPRRPAGRPQGTPRPIQSLRDFFLSATSTER